MDTYCGRISDRSTASHLAKIFSNYGLRKDPYNGKVRSMWESHNLWEQPQLLYACNQPDLSPKSAESDPSGRWAAGPQNVVHKLHSNSGEDKNRVTLSCLHKNRGAAP
jgi:hypothetical protein